MEAPGILSPFLAALCVMLISLSGVVFAAGRLGALVQKNLIYLATFSGGVFAIIVFHLLEETLHESSSFALAAGSIVFGAAIMQALHYLYPDTHHHHDVDHGHAHSSIDGRRVLVSDAFHNVGDGVLLVAAFAVNLSLGIAATIGIIIHELVQEVSEYFVLRGAGYSNTETLLRNFISSSTILLGVLFALYLASAEEIAILFAGIAAGGFLVILVQDLLPHALSSIKTGGSAWKHGAALCLGIGLMFSIQSFFGHEEPQKERVGEITSSRQILDTQS